ncbi:FMR1-interacting protein NUFIP1 [Hippocampus comes]|uniref:Nuclear FMR1 interacting protein 1 n=1 Tax=Hippocampus comes TaxID=109280 RepID=A0A3Q2XZ59_HIPCM|nr:PREDICTED: nuclear fragile X mental retardation-interacting protein 1 [Hippocampus comes]
MDNLGSYPPPNFDCPPPNTIQLSRSQPPSSRSSFHASMWTWNESPTEPQPNWAYGSQANCNYRPASGAASHSTNYGSQYSYGREWYHAGQQNWSNYRPAANRGKKRQNKKDPDFLHFCDTCDRGFKNQEKYGEHVAQHVKCSVPDCSFLAHEKIVSIHWKNTHAPGMKRIKLDTAEEIAKWREERRKNYPTLQNIEKKRKLMQEREKTGAVLETAQFGRMRGRGRRGRGHQRFHGPRPQGVHPSDAGAGAGRPPPLNQPGQNGDPLGALAKSDIESDKDDVDADSMATGPIVAPKQMSAALGSLVANYGSMSESETDEAAQDSTIQRAKKLLQENQDLLDQNNGPVMDAKTSTQDRQASNGSCPWSASNTSNNKQRGQGRRGGRRGRRTYQDMPQKRRATLLEMLLAPDIRHERNVLLQCVRYVVRNDFFGLESKTQLQLGIERTQAAGSSDQEVRNGCRTSSDSLFGRKRCSVEGGTSTPEAAIKPKRPKEENMDIGPANGTVKTTVDHCLTQNSLDRGPLGDQAGSGQLDDKALLGSSDNQSGTASDQARCGLSCPGAACQPPADEGVEADHLSTQKSNNALVDSIANTEQNVEDKEEPATTYHLHDSVAPCESKSTNNIYDDEIWEMSH